MSASSLCLPIYRPAGCCGYVCCFFPWADKQLGMFIRPVPCSSFVQEREEGGFGLAEGGDRRWSQLSHRLIALLTLRCCSQAAPHQGLMSLAGSCVSGWNHTRLLLSCWALLVTFCVLTLTVYSFPLSFADRFLRG